MLHLNYYGQLTKLPVHNLGGAVQRLLNTINGLKNALKLVCYSNVTGGYVGVSAQRYIVLVGKVFGVRKGVEPGRFRSEGGRGSILGKVVGAGACMLLRT